MTPEQAGLLESATRALQAAKSCAAENEHGAAVVSAHESIVCAARAVLLADGFSTSDHVGLIAAFGSRFVKTGRVPADFQRYLVDAQLIENGLSVDWWASAGDAAERIRRAEGFLRQAGEFLDRPFPE